MRICVIGAGYVGLTTAVSFALRGHSLILVDVVKPKVEMINDAISPIYEDGLSEALMKVRAQESLVATSNHAEAVISSEVVFLCVDTPTNGNGESNLDSLNKAVRQVAENLAAEGRYRVVAVKSTVPPTTTEGVVYPVLREMVRGDFGLCANPEFLREGVALRDALNPDRIVIGAIDQRSGDKMEELYSGFGVPIIRTTPATAEMIKYASNCLLATEISFSNEIANICELTPGVDVARVMDALHLDSRLSPMVNGERMQPGILAYLRAGCGYGGSCLPKDVRALITYAQGHGYQAPLLEAVQAVNQNRPLRLINILREEVGDLSGRTVAVLGLAFKPDTDDMRASPAIGVVEGLLREGAVVQAYDPKATDNAKRLWADLPSIRFAASMDEALQGADAAILVTAWSEFSRLSPEKMKRLMKKPFLVDGRRVIDAESLGPDVIYRGIGLGGRAKARARKD